MKCYFTTVSHKIVKNILYILGGIMVIGTFTPIVSLGQQFSDSEFPYDISAQNPNIETTDITQIVKEEAVWTPGGTNKPTIIKRLTDFFRLSGTNYDKPNSTSKATDYVKWILNILLGFVSFLSLVMIIFAFYLIFFSKGEDGVGKAKKILVGVGIALAIMWLSWFIASFFFQIYTTIT